MGNCCGGAGCCVIPTGSCPARGGQVVSIIGLLLAVIFLILVGRLKDAFACLDQGLKRLQTGAAMSRVPVPLCVSDLLYNLLE